MTANQTRTELGWPMMLAAVIVCAFASQVNTALGDWVQEAKLLPSDGAAADRFGSSVSISGSAAVIGAYWDDDNGHQSGSAYIFERTHCPADFDGDGNVDTADLLFLLGAWGTPDGDVDGDADTDTADLLALLAAWGECP